MKRFIKAKNQKGFTLVETLLAVFILITVSTMLINGFIATMAYSYQTSIYSKSGGYNYQTCMNTVATWNHLENKGDDGREAKGYAYNSAGNLHTLTFQTDGWPATFEELNVAITEETDLACVPGTLSYQSEKYAPTNGGLADNRKAILYYPEWCTDKTGGHLGEIIVMYDSINDEYYWVVDPGTIDLSTATKVVNTPIHYSSSEADSDA